MTNNLKQILFLKNIKGIGKAKIYKKYWHFLEENRTVEDMETIAAEMENGLTAFDISSAREQADRFYDALMNDPTITAITAMDEAYPERLNVMGTKRPLILYIKGNAKALDQPNIAVVGTRHPSEWSQKIEGRLVNRILSMSERVVVSGLAMGCDQIAHTTAVNAKKPTIAVLPSGVNVITPSCFTDLTNDILQTGGCLVSEYEPETKANRAYFVERDAVMAALADITLVVECDVSSGTMHTVDAAAKYHRTLACYYPTDFEKGSYSGNKFMVQSKGAVKIENLEDLIELFSTAEENQPDIEGMESQQLSFDDLLKGK